MGLPKELPHDLYECKPLSRTIESFVMLNKIVPQSFRLRGFENHKYTLVAVCFEGFYAIILGKRDDVQQYIRNNYEEDIFEVGGIEEALGFRSKDYMYNYLHARYADVPYTLREVWGYL